MIPVDQTKFTDENNGTHGNCMAACVASLLELPLSIVPSWEDMGSDGSWGDSFVEFLAEHGCSFEGCLFHIDESKDWWKGVKHLSCGVDGYFIIGGSSPRSKRGHAVLYKDGKLVHDPHFDRAGVGKVEEVYLIERGQPRVTANK